MKTLVIILVCAVIAGGLLMNIITGFARKECAKGCPDNPAALKVHFELGPVSFATCVCEGKGAHGE